MLVWHLFLYQMCMVTPLGCPYYYKRLKQIVQNKIHYTSLKFVMHRIYVLFLWYLIQGGCNVIDTVD